MTTNEKEKQLRELLTTIDEPKDLNIRNLELEIFLESTDIISIYNYNGEYVVYYQCHIWGLWSYFARVNNFAEYIEYLTNNEDIEVIEYKG